ncbi:MAG: VOC family protein [Gemmatimonadota bacterium]
MKSPSGSSIAPMLSVRRGSEALAFYKKAFDTEELFKIESDDGAVVAELGIGGARFWVADESPEHLNYSPESLNGSTTRMILVVADPAAVYAKAVAAGAREIHPVGELYGWLMGRVQDPFGHHWEIGKPLQTGMDEVTA